MSCTDCELLRRGVDHPEPHEAGLGAADRGRLGRAHPALVLARTVAVVRAVDDHGRVSTSSATRPSSATSSARRNGASAGRDDHEPLDALGQREQHAHPGAADERERGQVDDDRLRAQLGQLGLDGGEVELVDLPRDPHHREPRPALERDERGPGGHRGRVEAGGPVAHGHGRAVRRLVDLDLGHQRPHDRQPAAAVPGVERRRPPASAVAHHERHRAGELARRGHLDGPARALGIRVLDRVRAQLGRRRARASRRRRGPRRPSPASCASPRARPRAGRAGRRTTAAAGVISGTCTRATSSATSSERRGSAVASSWSASASGASAPSAAPASRASPASSPSPRRSIAPSEYRISVPFSARDAVASV